MSPQDLPALDTGTGSTCGYDPPQGEIETMLAAIWVEVLGRASVGRHDHFFELGGNSVQAMQVIVRLRQAADIEVEIADIFLHPELSMLSDRILSIQLEQFDAVDIDNLWNNA